VLFRILRGNAITDTADNIGNNKQLAVKEMLAMAGRRERETRVCRQMHS
jgi:hypothetical protein